MYLFITDVLNFAVSGCIVKHDLDSVWKQGTYNPFSCELFISNIYKVKMLYGLFINNFCWKLFTTTEFIQLFILTFQTWMGHGNHSEYQGNNVIQYEILLKVLNKVMNK